MPTLVATLNPVKLEPYIDPQNTRTLALDFAPSQTLARGTIIGQTTTGSLAKAYASGNADGSQVPVGILVYDIVVGSDGNVTYGPTGATSDLTRGFEITAPIYWKGTFLQSQLVGLDANAITVMKARTNGIGTLATITIG